MEPSPIRDNDFPEPLWDQKYLDKKMYTKTCFQTFFVQKIVGTGLPEALHSKVTAPPLRAVIWPLDGTARTLDGTEN